MERAWRHLLIQEALVALALWILVALSIIVDNKTVWSTWSLLGEEYIYVFTGLLLFYLGNPYTGLQVILAVATSGALNLALKYYFNTPRPPNPLTEASGPGFPSGHVQVSTSFWTALALATGSRLLTAASIPIVTGIALSRLYLRAHYPVDVAGGIVLGLAVALALSMLHKGERHLSKVVQVAGLTTIALTIIALALGSGESATPALLGLGIALTASGPFIEESLRELAGAGTRSRLLMLTIIALATVILYQASKASTYARVASFTVIGLAILGTPVIYTRIRAHARKQ